MKKTLVYFTLVLALLLSLSSVSFGQTTSVQSVILNRTATTVGNVLNLGDNFPGIRFHRLLFYSEGTVTTCQVKLEVSTTGTGGWTDLISNQTCTSTGISATLTVDANYVRINLGTFSGTGNVTVVYQGFLSATSAVSGTVTVDEIIDPLPPGNNNIGDVDVASVVPGTGATNLGKAVDSPGGATDSGVATLCIRDDTLTTLTPIDGDYIQCRVSSTGGQWVTNTVLDEAIDSPSVNNPVYVGAIFETTPATVATGDRTALHTTATQQLIVGGAQAPGAVLANNNPMVVAGWDSGGAVRTLGVISSGEVQMGQPLGGDTDATGTAAGSPSYNYNYLVTVGKLFNGATMDRPRSAGVGNNVASTGLAAQAQYIQYNTATQAPTAANYMVQQADSRGNTLVTLDHINRFSCFVAASTATTIQAFGGSCAAPGAGLSLYVTDISASTNASGVAADSFLTIKEGTGGTCGSSTVVRWGAFTAALIQQPVHESFITPFKITANSEICWINSTAGSKTWTINGYIAP